MRRNLFFAIISCLNKLDLLFRVDKDKGNACGRFISITSEATGITAQAQVLEKCGDVKGSSALLLSCS